MASSSDSDAQAIQGSPNAADNNDGPPTNGSTTTLGHPQTTGGFQINLDIATMVRTPMLCDAYPSDTVASLTARIRKAISTPHQITLTAPTHGAIFDRPGLMGDRVLPGTNVPCTYLTHHTYVGVHLRPQAYLCQERTTIMAPVHEKVFGQLPVSTDRKRKHLLSAFEAPTASTNSECNDVSLTENTHDETMLPPRIEPPLPGGFVIRMEFSGLLIGQHPYFVRHSDTIAILRTRIQHSFDAITFTLPPNGPVFDRPGLIGDCVVHNTNVPCAHLMRNTYMGVYFGTPSNVRRERTPPATVPIPFINTYPAPRSAYTSRTTINLDDEPMQPAIQPPYPPRVPLGRQPCRMYSRYGGLRRYRDPCFVKRSLPKQLYWNPECEPTTSRPSK
jgi:hypothetical protein